MRKILLLLFILYSSLFANSDSTINYIDNKTFSIQFRITEDFSISDFQGSILSAKYNFAENSAIRIGISSSFSISDSIHSAGQRPISKKESFYIKIMSQYIYYISKNKLSLYIGAGPNYSHNYFLNTESIHPVNASGRYEIRKRQNINYAIGCNSVIGGEVFITKFLSIMVEYGVIFEYSYKDEYDKITGISKLKEYMLYPIKVNFGFSLNF